MFYVVATPIGNLEDISLRALRILKEVNFILCEDTRVAKKLLNYYEIKTSLISYHQHSKIKKIKLITNLLEQNKDLALISDAGTPAVSDPGGKLIKIIAEKFTYKIIEAIPGPSALITAWSISGISGDRFLFLGFLPHKKGRQKFLQKIKNSEYPIICYESKHRIFKLLQELEDLKIEDEKKVMVFRELTKLHQSVYQGSIKEIISYLEKNKVEQKGEFVVIIS